jgi:hypothetical protein
MLNGDFNTCTTGTKFNEASGKQEARGAVNEACLTAYDEDFGGGGRYHCMWYVVRGSLSLTIRD